MGKLLKLQIKENLKTLIWVWIIPLLLSAVFIYLNRVYDNELTQMGIGISMFLLFLGIAASGLIVLYTDYQRFFGREAIFYQSLPVSPSATTWSRFFNYLISGLMIFAVLIIDLSIIGIIGGDFDIEGIMELYKIIIASLGEHPRETLLFLMMMISGMVSSIFMFIFCINVGSQKTFKSMGIFGPILIYILLNVVMQIFAFILLNIIPTGQGSYLAQLAQNHTATYEEFINLFGMFFVAISVLNIVMAAVYGLVAKYSQDKKLSVG